MENVWTIARVLDWTKQYFADKGLESPRLDAEILLCSVLNCQRIMLYVHFDQPMQPEELALYKKYVLRRAAFEPLAYILGKRAFMNNDFVVEPGVLVPRPETELLVESIVKVLAKAEALHILELGTGSGAIVVSLLELLTQARATGVDVSPQALKVTKLNAERLGVDDRLTLYQSDLYAALPSGSRFDLVISNPPYIPAAEIAGLAKDVQREPRLALDGGRDGLSFYRRIIAGADKYLNKDGLLAFEIGCEQAQAVCALLSTQGFSVQAVRKDYAELDRMVFATKEGSCYGDAILELK